MDALNASLKPDPSLPLRYWNQLTQDDKIEFLKLRSSLRQNQKPASIIKDHRLTTFSNELLMILKYIEHDEIGREPRSVLAGISFAGPFICVNTRHLKDFVGRCKSSINGSLQQLGYMAVRTKSKARDCVLACMPILANDSNQLRQWTVRGASDNTLFCFVSNYQPNPMPIIQPEDLNEEKKIVHIQLKNLEKPKLTPQPKINKLSFSKQDLSKAQVAIQNIIMSVLSNSAYQNKLNSSQNQFESDSRDLSTTDNFKLPELFASPTTDMPPSFSADYLSKYYENDWGNEFNNNYDLDEFYLPTHKIVSRSQSAFFPRNDDLSGFDDTSMFS